MDARVFLRASLRSGVGFKKGEMNVCSVLSVSGQGAVSEHVHGMFGVRSFAHCVFLPIFKIIRVIA